MERDLNTRKSEFTSRQAVKSEMNSFTTQVKEGVKRAAENILIFAAVHGPFGAKQEPDEQESKRKTAAEQATELIQAAYRFARESGATPGQALQESRDTAKWIQEKGKVNNSGTLYFEDDTEDASSNKPA